MPHSSLWLLYYCISNHHHSHIHIHIPDLCLSPGTGRGIESWEMMMEGSIRCSANYVPLTPITFLERSAVVYPDKPSLLFGDVTYTWSHTHQRCLKLASSISHLGVSPGDVVCFVSQSTPLPSFLPSISTFSLPLFFISFHTLTPIINF